MINATLIYNAQLLDETMDTAGALLIVDSKIRAVFQGYFTSPDTASSLAHSVLQEDGCDQDSKLQLYDAQGMTVTPAFIDMHVHLRYPGQTEKEDLDSGLHAAACGGFGTIVAMPNTTPVVSSFEQAMKIEKEAAKIGLSHLFQSVSITKNFEGEDVSHLKDLDRKFIPLITEDGRDVLKANVMLDGMKIAKEKGIVVSCHCEDPSLALAARPHRQEALKMMKYAGLSAWGTNIDSNVDLEIKDAVINQIDDELTKANDLLALAEDTATMRNLLIADKSDVRIHIAHVSTKNAIDSIREAKRFMNATCEVTPHHLALTGSEEPYIRALVNPPLRTEEDRLALIDALRDGTADVISTDHAPHTLQDKENGSPGFTGLELSYAVCNTVLVKENNFNPRRLSQLMSASPAKILGLQKGLIKAGYDADLTILNPEEEWVVDSSLFYSKGKATPFEGKKLIGKVKSLFVDGRLVFEA